MRPPDRSPGSERRIGPRLLLYRALLILLPRGLRLRSGPQILGLYTDLEREALERGGRAAAWWFWARACVDVVASMPRAYREERRAKQRRKLETSPSAPPRTWTRKREMMSTLRHDVAVALRLLRQNPGFTAVAALTLALGIGANTAIFSVVYGVLLRPLGIERATDVAVVSLHREGDPADATGFAPGFLESVRELATATDHVEQITGYVFESSTLLQDGDVEELGSVIVADPHFFEVARPVPLVGRLLGPEDARGAQLSETIVIDETLWRSRFGADPEIVGTTIVLDGEPRTIVGVVPANLPLPQAGIQVWMTQQWDVNDYTLLGRIGVLARLSPETPRDSARDALRAATQSLRSDFPRYDGYTVSLAGFREALVGDVRQPILFAAGAVGLILLIACANMANLLLARAAAREREMATRRALGARGSQVLSQLTAESLALAALGGALGVALALALHRLLISIAPSVLPRLSDVRLDLPVLIFATVASLVTGLFFGLAPMAHTFRLDLARSVTRGLGSSSRRPGTSWVRQSMVVVQVALAVTLLSAGGLMVRSLSELRAVDPGYDPTGVGGARIYLDAAAYPDDDAEFGYFERLLEQLRGRTDIAAAGASSGLPTDPVTIDYDLPFVLPGEDPSQDIRQAFFRTISPGFFETMRIPLLEGRSFDSRDRADGLQVAIINRTFAELAWADESPVGKSFAIYGGRRELRIVGVVGDVHFSGPAADFKPEFYVPFGQQAYGAMTVVARAEDGGYAASAVAETALAIDRSQPVNSTFTLEALMRGAISQDRFLTLLLVAFATLALLLAAAGIYGVISYWVQRSRREIGVRMAFGATASTIAGLVLRRSLTVVGIGLLLGLATSQALGRIIQRFLFEVTPVDATALVSVVAVLLVTSLLASLLPALRAARLDPYRSLRLD